MIMVNFYLTYINKQLFRIFLLISAMRSGFVCKKFQGQGGVMRNAFLYMTCLHYVTTDKSRSVRSLKVIDPMKPYLQSDDSEFYSQHFDSIIKLKHLKPVVNKVSYKCPQAHDILIYLFRTPYSVKRKNYEAIRDYLFPELATALLAARAGSF